MDELNKLILSKMADQTLNLYKELLGIKGIVNSPSNEFTDIL